MGHNVAGAFRCRSGDIIQDAISIAWKNDAHVKMTEVQNSGPMPEFSFIVDSDNETKLLRELKELNDTVPRPVPETSPQPPVDRDSEIGKLGSL